MRRSTDRLIALQFLAVAVPIAFVLLAQMVADARRAAALEHSRPLRTLANRAGGDSCARSRPAPPLWIIRARCARLRTRRAPTIAPSPTEQPMRSTPVRSA